MDDASSLLAEHELFSSKQIEKPEFKALSFHCRDCQQWCVVCDDEIPDSHKGHDLDVIHTLHSGDSVWFKRGTVHFYVD